MSRPLIGPVPPDGTPPESRRLLEEITKALGRTPNLFLTAAHSPAALRSLWSQVEAAGRMRLPARLREAMALRVAEMNGCSYCLAAHTAAGKAVGIDSAQALQYRRGISSDAKEQALLNLVSKIVEDRGHHAGFEVEAARKVGFTEVEINEVIALAALFIYVNYLTSVAITDSDFPAVDNLEPPPDDS